MNAIQRGILLALLPCSWVAHAAIDEPVIKAMADTLSGKPAEAFSALAVLEEVRAGDPDFDLALGIAANRSKQFNRAIFALERVVVSQPQNLQAHRELARALYAVGQAAQAREVLNRIRTDDAPVDVASTMDQFLQSLDKADAKGRRYFKAHVEGVAGMDTNVNGAPNDDSVAVPAFGGSVVTLNSDGQKVRSNFIGLRAGISDRYALSPEWSVFGRANVNLRANDTNANQFDTRAYAALGGVMYRKDKHEFSLGWQAVNEELYSNAFRQQGGLLGEWTYRLDGFRQFGTFVQLGEVRYSAQSARDMKRQVAGGTYVQVFPSGVTAYGGLYIGSERAMASNQNALGHNLSGTRLGAQMAWTSTLSGFASWGFESRTFGGDDTLFQTTRSDRQHAIDLGLSWVPAPQWRVTPMVSWLQTESNISINTYTKSTAAVAVRREF
ncbi:porin family protein [Rhodoferax sp.]|uniref:porin family protein n=1 Tax=Rhodoferax sp. TaxID=50421 RepID=UPI0025EFA31B|nr:porin family protein [Rhodoferax sp.]